MSAGGRCCRAPRPRTEIEGATALCAPRAIPGLRQRTRPPVQALRRAAKPPVPRGRPRWLIFVAVEAADFRIARGMPTSEETATASAQELTEELPCAFLSGAAKNCSGSAASTTSPLSMNTTLSATRRANPISWVTTIMVMPSRASAVIVSSTSLTISGSSAEVGSSNSMIFGFMQSARAMATRCCCPPESWVGYLCAWSAMLHFCE